MNTTQPTTNETQGAVPIGSGAWLDAIVCDDCMKVLPSLPDKSVDCVITDPPYGLTACEWDVPVPMTEWWAEIMRVTRGAVIVMAMQPFATDVITANRAEFRYEMVWDKIACTGFLNAGRRPLAAHELCLVFGNTATYNPQKVAKTEKEIRRGWLEGKKYSFIGKPRREKGVYNVSLNEARKDPTMKNPTTLMRFSSGNGHTKSKYDHPTQKPISLMQYLVQTYTNPGEIVMDCFAGSGTTLVAAKQLNRRFVGIEKESKYVQIANRRLEQSAMCLGV